MRKGVKGRGFEKYPPLLFKGKKTMARPIKVFEPITSEQIVKIHARAREIGLLEAGLHEMIAALADIPLMTALSKQEAIVLIEQLEGNYERPYPAKPRYSDEVEGDASQLPQLLPRAGHPADVPATGLEQGASQNWLVKYRKEKNIRSMGRKQAKATWAVLKGMVERKGGTWE